MSVDSVNMLKLTSLLIFIVSVCDSANILAILPTASKSHGIWNKVILEELASKGHNIISLDANPGKNTSNLSYINIENSYAVVEKLPDYITLSNYGSWPMIHLMYGLIAYNCYNQIESNGVKQLLNTKQKFDLILFESLGNECFLGFLEYFNAPTVAISAYGCYAWDCKSLGEYAPVAVYPDQLLSYKPGELTFWQRINNMLTVWHINISKYLFYGPIQYLKARSIFGSNLSYLQDIQDKYYKLMLINSGPSGVDSNVVIPASIVEVGCLHCKPGKTLPKDIKEFLDSAKDGAIFFSLGSNVRSDTLKPEIINAILKTFSKLPYKVLWKFESEIPNKPDNVKIGRWLPQQDILAHPNVKLFITHGGKLSAYESLYHGVPILGIPIFADQYANSEKIKNLGFGEIIYYNEINYENFMTIINKLMTDPRYINNAKDASALIKDQPQTPLERAIFWIEYVIRHGHKTNLRAETTKLAWYQLLYLDIIEFDIILILSIYFIIKFIRNRRSAKNKKEKSN